MSPTSVVSGCRRWAAFVLLGLTAACGAPASVEQVEGTAAQGPAAEPDVGAVTQSVGFVCDDNPAKLCIGGEIDTSKTLSVSRSSGVDAKGKTLITAYEAAQTFEISETTGSLGYPSSVKLVLRKEPDPNPDARLYVDIRGFSATAAKEGAAIPAEPTATTALATASIPVADLSADFAEVTLPLSTFGKPRVLSASTAKKPQRYAVVLRIDGGDAVVNVGVATELDPTSFAGTGRGRLRQRERTPPAVFKSKPWTDMGADDVALVISTESAAMPSCMDGIAQTSEADVDCGGVCSAQCKTGKKCRVGADCLTNACVAGKCAITACSNAKWDAGETDKNCGGTECAKCKAGRRCLSSDDCAVGLSCLGGNNLGGGTCAPETCSDGNQGQLETSPDCGGGTCAPCGDGGICKADADCLSRKCVKATKTDLAGLCAESSASDKRIGANETDVDCGGASGKQCALTKRCVIDGDCVSGRCDRGVCSKAACTDKALSSGETDVDCGGACVIESATNVCADQKRCLTGTDCKSGYCLGANADTGVKGVCKPSTCGDGVKNSGETDVDCGGKCGACVLGQACLAKTDCQTGNCKAKVCAEGTHADTTRNLDETDVDCGGTVVDNLGQPAKRCKASKLCASTADCDLNLWCDPATSKCKVSTCSDGVRNGQETGVDCGGNCVDTKAKVAKGEPKPVIRCTAGKECQNDAECVDGLICRDGRCATGECFNGVRDLGESDQDCGGTCSAKCSLGRRCTAHSDCPLNSACSDYFCRCPPGVDCSGIVVDPLCEGVVCDDQFDNLCLSQTGRCQPVDGSPVCVYAPKALNTNCSDGISCTGPDTCDGEGQCVAGFDHSQECSVGSSSRPCAGTTECAGEGTGTFICQVTFADAGTVCRPTAGSCDVEETCSGTTDQCPADAFADNRALCTTENGTPGACDAVGVCVGGCDIGPGYRPGEANPDNPCLVCDPAKTTSDWSPRAAGFDCTGQDSYWCSQGETCDGAGKCGFDSASCSGSGSCAFINTASTCNKFACVGRGPSTAGPADCPAGMIFIPGGEFTMGTSLTDEEVFDPSTPHLVRLSPYCIDAREVTVGQIEQSSDPDAATGVSLTEALAYCASLGSDFSLPSEAQWEFAARGCHNEVNARVYPWSQASPSLQLSCAVANYSGQEEAPQSSLDTSDIGCQDFQRLSALNCVPCTENSVCGSGTCTAGFCSGGAGQCDANKCREVQTASGTTVKCRSLGVDPSNSRPSGASPWGVLNMSGNAAEWVLDRYYTYEATPSAGPEQDPVYNATSGDLLFRGGAWGMPDFYASATYRGVVAEVDESQFLPWLGVRCVKNLQ